MSNWEKLVKQRQEELNKLDDNDPEYISKWIEINKRLDPLFGYED